MTQEAEEEDLQHRGVPRVTPPIFLLWPYQRMASVKKSNIFEKGSLLLLSAEEETYTWTRTLLFRQASLSTLRAFPSSSGASTSSHRPHV